MSKNEVIATLKYTLDLRLEGNKAPIIFCCHSAPYANFYQNILNTNYTDRQEVIEEFIDYALTKDSVRFVSIAKIINWMQFQLKSQNNYMIGILNINLFLIIMLFGIICIIIYNKYKNKL